MIVPDEMQRKIREVRAERRRFAPLEISELLDTPGRDFDIGFWD